MTFTDLKINSLEETKMKNNFLSKILITLLVSGIAITIGTGIPLSVHAGDQGEPSFKQKKENRSKHHKIREQEEKTLKSKDKSHSRHVKSLIKQYEESAKIVARQGGDPAPLLAAADYYRNQR